MIIKADLLKELSKTRGKTKVNKLTALLARENIDLQELIDLTFYPDKTIAFRSAWLLENMFLKYPDRFIPYINSLISRVKEVDNPSCKRHYAKILMHLTAPKALAAIREKLMETDMEQVIEQCFDWLIDPKILIAVKVFASETLFNMRHRYPWVSTELAQQLQFLMRDGTAAIQARGKKLLGYLNTGSR